MTGGALDPGARLQHALDAAYRFLARRERTVLEVRRHLESKRMELATIEEAVAELERQGHLDDVRYAYHFAEDRRTLDGWGTERIERRLRAAGIDATLVAAAVTRRDGEDELEAALSVLRRRYSHPPADDRDRERAFGVLVRKGYELGLAYEAVRAFERDAA